MTSAQRDKFITSTMSAAIAGIVVGLIMLYFQTGVANGNELEEEVKGKVDIEVFESFKKDNLRDHNRINETLKSKANKETVELMWEDVKTIKEDIKELLKQRKKD